ncbi:MAG: NADP-dependent oxidoreductase [Planctomycetia bacterium]|nr:NADP-dependent oxidoreductase [Planctomycetia bacterium]
MKAWQFDDTSPALSLVQADVPAPHPGPGELLVRVHAVGVTPSELLWYPTTHTRDGAARHLAIPGHDFSGVVVEADPGCGFHVGQEVFGMNDWYADGATAEFCRTTPAMIAPKPALLSHVEAASLPIAALTAWQGLFERAKLQPGEHVLIHGGAGAVGVIAIQLAHWRGAKVTTTASARHQEILLQLGAERVIDYRTQRFEDVVHSFDFHGVDVIFDCVGGDTLARSWNVLAPGGRLVTIAASGESADGTGIDERTKQAFFIVVPKGAQLRDIAAILETGQLRPVIDEVFSFDQAASAYMRQATASHVCGRTVVSVVSTQP